MNRKREAVPSTSVTILRISLKKKLKKELALHVPTAPEMSHHPPQVYLSVEKSGQQLRFS